MSDKYQILGQAAASNRDALMAIRRNAWRDIQWVSDRWPTIVMHARREIFAAEDELLFWPLESPQEAAMI